MLTWAAPGNYFGAAHTVDLPLLFGNKQTWATAGLVAGATWDDIDAPGRALRAIWARFASGEGLDTRGELPGTLRYRSA